MGKIARQHHFVPAFYLTGFTPLKNKDNKMWVINTKNKECWQCRPAKAARQKDFYKVDMEDIEPDSLEMSLGYFESHVTNVLKRIDLEKKLPDKRDDYLYLINFVALMALRTPRFVERYKKFVEDVGKKIIQVSCATEERWNKISNRMKSEGFDIPDNLQYKDFKQHAFSNDCRIEVNRTFILSIMIKSIENVLPLFLERNWSLLIRDSKSPEFICSDSPVSITWTQPVHHHFPPGFGCKNTEVSMPLNKDMALFGSFETQSLVRTADNIDVGITNYLTYWSSTRELYSAKKKNIFITPDKKLISTNELLGKLKVKK